jgi:sigma-B regulation protein RsbU (phosphoserine phosphatase)
MTQELAITSPDGKATTMRLEGHRLTLGRSAGNELCYPEDVGLSRQHMALEQEGDHWVVYDLGSKNKTFVNGVATAGRVRLRPGDRIVTSRVTLVYEPAGERAEQTVLFERTPTPSGDTVSTTLQRLLSSDAATARLAPGAAAPLWGTPLTALVRAGRELAARRPLPELFQVILDLAMESVGARRGVLLTGEQGRLSVQATRGEDFRISTTVRDHVLEGKASLLIRDAQSDEALRERASIVRQSVRALMAVPLQTDDRVIGLIYVDTPQFLREFTEDDLNLLTVMANVAAIRIERERLIEVEQSEKLMASELEQAAEIQRRFLPSDAPAIPGLDLAGYNAPCHTVGGDYYDFLPYPDGRVALVIADVAGKGMAAALMMTCLQANVHAVAEYGDDPAGIVTRLNHSIAATCPGNRFVTLFFGVVNPQTGELIYCNAGHNPPLLVRSDGELLRLEGGGPVVGILPNLTFQEQRCRMEPGDALLLYSDGVTEASNPGGEEFGEERLAEILRERRQEPAEAIVNAVNEAVENFTAGQPPADDITVVVARRAEVV